VRRASRDQGGNQGQGGNWIRKPKRAAIYARDGHRCIWCSLPLLGITNGERTLDHVRPRSAFPDGARGKNGPHAASNLVTACMTCNTSRGALAALPWVTALLESQGLEGAALSTERARVLERVWAALDTPLATAPPV
jgi:5-methylcytosine-specific restriction endonuclease McrA